MQLRVTQGLAFLKAPLTTEAYPAAYGVGRVFQVGPCLAGIVLNIRAGGVNVIDFEMGADLILFDDVRRIDVAKAVPLKRNETLEHPQTGAPIVLVKYPGNVGFVPVGTRLSDGTPHPHAGTGFSVGKNIGVPADLSVRRYQDTPDPYSCMEIQQYRYDGAHFEITKRKSVAADELLDGWDGWGAGMSAALPDGEDLLMPFYGWARTATAPVGGGASLKMPLISRWKRMGEEWRPVSVVAVTDAAGCMEPSLIRDRDGAFLLCARHGWPPTKDNPSACLRVWRSLDGVAWTRCLNIDGLRSSGPVALSRTAGGHPFIAGNTANPGGHPRASISAWLLGDDRASAASNLVLLDAEARFGPAPVFAWNADHPIGAVVRLGDGRLHSLEAMRVCENTEVVRDTLPTPSTGCYIEEIFDDRY